jgi:hypothetical protein
MNEGYEMPTQRRALLATELAAASMSSPAQLTPQSRAWAGACRASSNLR